jgi:hypothetical protein
VTTHVEGYGDGLWVSSAHEVKLWRFSDAASYVNGAAIPIDGGQIA